MLFHHSVISNNGGPLKAAVLCAHLCEGSGIFLGAGFVVFSFCCGRSVNYSGEFDQVVTHTVIELLTTYNFLARGNFQLYVTATTLCMQLARSAVKIKGLLVSRITRPRCSINRCWLVTGKGRDTAGHCFHCTFRACLNCRILQKNCNN